MRDRLSEGPAPVVVSLLAVWLASFAVPATNAERWVDDDSKGPRSQVNPSWWCTARWKRHERDCPNVFQLEPKSEMPQLL